MGDGNNPTEKKERANPFSHSKNGKTAVDETLDRLKINIFKAAELKAKANSKKKNPVEVSEDHFHQGIDFILKGQSKSWWYWFWRFVIALVMASGLVLVKEGLFNQGITDETIKMTLIVGGTVLFIFAICFDKVVLEKI